MCRCRLRWNSAVGLGLGFVLALVLFAMPGFAITIVVDHGDVQDVRQSAFSEADVNWLDGDALDDTLCTECFAAVELQRYLRQINGGDQGFEIKDDDALPPGDVILVGGPATNRQSKYFCEKWKMSEKQLESLGPEGYRIYSSKVDDEQYALLLAGGGRVGTLYAAYDLLYRLGVRWFAPGELHEEVPSMKLYSLPHLDETETPDFKLRGFHAWENRGSQDFLLWMARNRLNYWCVQQEEQDLMNKLGIHKVGGGHVLTSHYLLPSDSYPYDHPTFQGDEKQEDDPYPVSEEYRGDANGDGKLSYFEAHPEWYALIDGKRSSHISRSGGGHNYCTSNKDATREFMRKAVEDLVSGRYKNADILNCWMLDAGKWCTCENCLALGTPTDRNLLFVYEFDKAIKEAQAGGLIHRPIILLFLAYSDVLEPPTHPLPEDFDYETCIATYFPIVRCYVHRFDDPACSRNARYAQHLHGWAVDPERHYKGQLCIGEYYNVSGYKCLPVCYMNTMSHDIPHYYELGARYFHYMHCTTGNWGNKSLTNYQMARQLWNKDTDAQALFRGYLRERYGKAAREMKSFYGHLEAMLCNVSELKYGLARRLDKGAEQLFPTSHLQYETTEHETDDGPDLVEMLEEAAACREALKAALAKEIPDKARARVEEDERLFTYGERTLQFYDAAVRALRHVRAGRRQEAKTARKELVAVADLLREDTVSTTLSSSHANANNALSATYAVGVLAVLEDALGPLAPEEMSTFSPEAPLIFRGSDFLGGGATRFGYHLHVFPGRIQVSDDGNYVYGGGGRPYDRMTAWFRVDELPAGTVKLEAVGLRCPDPPGGTVQAKMTLNQEVLFEGSVPFPEKELGELRAEVPAEAFKKGDNRLEIRNMETEGRTGGRPWFGVDRVVLTP